MSCPYGSRGSPWKEACQKCLIGLQGRIPSGGAQGFKWIFAPSPPPPARRSNLTRRCMCFIWIAGGASPKWITFIFLPIVPGYSLPCSHAAYREKHDWLLLFGEETCQEIGGLTPRKSSKINPNRLEDGQALKARPVCTSVSARWH